MARFIFTSVLAAVILLFVSCNGNTKKETSAEKSNATTEIQVIQFHSEHRCVTCIKIEELTKIALKKYPQVSFTLVNADDKKNEALCTEFEAFGSALFIYNTKTKKIKNLSHMAFMNAAGNPDKFIKEFHENMDAFLKL